ncbi:GGDEF domain-containing protein [Ornithinibacillus halophilus]|uniref:Diguanylate cyclase (GGDEF) domain-containing protein n=1 Tax=Ornithinibacillus halophilus TaxID=930117 RepID=A0A1M5HFU7_9BACI|nr:GGDEF domain-containing protein [Ornithinibacillus halophilus]SHG14825.1 diguanylate cyclase (GGDEF) domain-containing protein [Ornithinibacillus halophilus]
MKSKFRIRLFLIMITFAVVISFTIATVNYIRERGQAIESNKIQVDEIETSVSDSIAMIDKAYNYFDEDTRVQMYENTEYLMDLYHKNPNVENWDYEDLKQALGMDIYIIDNENTIIQSSFIDDIGLNFSECCSEFASLLDERRESGEFHADGMDLQQKTGEIKKFSYMATPDKQYIIELGFSLEEGTIFKEFNFFNVIDDLVQRYPSLDAVNLLNTDGFLYGEVTEETHLPSDRYDAFEEAVRTQDVAELKSDWNGKSAQYRYVYYNSDLTQGISTNRVLELVYNDYELQSVLMDNTKAFILQLIIILIVSVIVALIISKWLAWPMYLAFHDSLTELKNRASFDDDIQLAIADNRKPFALFMIDLDNFKLVNDYLGHDRGDYVLKQVGKTIKKAIPEKGSTYRLGGDEFAVIVPIKDEVEAEKIAQNIIKEFKKQIYKHNEIGNLNVTASVGISIGPRHGLDAETLSKKADIALYHSKEKGKNCYAVFGEFCVDASNK